MDDKNEFQLSHLVDEFLGVQEPRETIAQARVTGS
jgi:hypothetical protein